MWGKTDIADEISLAITILGLIVIGLILMLLIRIQRGLLGFILAVLAMALLIYWLREVRKKVKEELLPTVPPSKTEWVYDIIDHVAEVTVVAEVPGPESEVKANLMNHNLEISGGQSFRKLVSLPEEVEIVETTYLHGILQVKLKKKTTKGSSQLKN